MATDHPRDEHGRILPDPSWPPGREAPGELEFLRRFLNTRNRENGADRCATALGIGGFLEDQGRIGFLPEPDERLRILAVRESLHGMVIAHGRGEPVQIEAAGFGEVRLGVTTTDGGLAVVARGATPAARLLSDLVRIVVVHTGDASWERLIACANCQWVVFDTSRNHGGRWCSMGACGGRHNARAYRRRVGDGAS